MNSHTENRHFHRIPFDARVRVVDGERTWEAGLLDLSLKGALIQQPADWSNTLGASCRLEIFLSPDQHIDMQATVAHMEDQRVGFRCDYIDLDSVTHLRRLVELNTGDPTLLDRELSALVRGNT